MAVQAPQVAQRPTQRRRRGGRAGDAGGLEQPNRVALSLAARGQGGRRPSLPAWPRSRCCATSRRLQRPCSRASQRGAPTGSLLGRLAVTFWDFHPHDGRVGAEPAQVAAALFEPQRSLASYAGVLPSFDAELHAVRLCCPIDSARPRSPPITEATRLDESGIGPEVVQPAAHHPARGHANAGVNEQPMVRLPALQGPVHRDEVCNRAASLVELTAREPGRARGARPFRTVAGRVAAEGRSGC